MTRFARFALAALAAAALMSSAAQAYPLKQPYKPVMPQPQKPVNFNPKFMPKKPPVIVTPNPKFYPKPYYPKYPIVVPVQTVVQPVYVAGRPAPRVAAPGKTECLNKEVTAEGLVIFADRCTGEIATTTVPGSPAAVAA